MFLFLWLLILLLLSSSVRLHKIFSLVSLLLQSKMLKPRMAFLVFIMIILHLSSGANYGSYSCNDCIIGRQNGRNLCRQCVLANSGTPFTCRRCSPGTELSNYNCKGCRNKNPEFGEKSVETELYLNII